MSIAFDSYSFIVIITYIFINNPTNIWKCSLIRTCLYSVFNWEKNVSAAALSIELPGLDNQINKFSLLENLLIQIEVYW
ncbi:hypothetical protein [Spiroplasma endosymbiont of Aspidapion aeneum]|uniref:hypothetical protein n=1 Tax=Spiroplasma endosymbiont of Aspidapion aeneum TaxID=3066276 RepID=UPI00313F37E7